MAEPRVPPRLAEELLRNDRAALNNLPNDPSWPATNQRDSAARLAETINNAQALTPEMAALALAGLSDAGIRRATNPVLQRFIGLINAPLGVQQNVSPQLTRTLSVTPPYRTITGNTAQRITVSHNRRTATVVHPTIINAWRDGLEILRRVPLPPSAAPLVEAAITGNAPANPQALQAAFRADFERMPRSAQLLYLALAGGAQPRLALNAWDNVQNSNETEDPREPAEIERRRVAALELLVTAVNPPTPRGTGFSAPNGNDFSIILGGVMPSPENRNMIDAQHPIGSVINAVAGRAPASQTQAQRQMATLLQNLNRTYTPPSPGSPDDTAVRRGLVDTIPELVMLRTQQANLRAMTAAQIAHLRRGGQLNQIRAQLQQSIDQANNQADRVQQGIAGREQMAMLQTGFQQNMAILQECQQDQFTWAQGMQTQCLATFQAAQNQYMAQLNALVPRNNFEANQKQLLIQQATINQQAALQIFTQQWQTYMNGLQTSQQTSQQLFQQAGQLGLVTAQNQILRNLTEAQRAGIIDALQLQAQQQIAPLTLESAIAQLTAAAEQQQRNLDRLVSARETFWNSVPTAQLQQRQTLQNTIVSEQQEVLRRILSTNPGAPVQMPLLMPEPPLVPETSPILTGSALPVPPVSSPTVVSGAGANPDPTNPLPASAPAASFVYADVKENGPIGPGNTIPTRKPQTHLPGVANSNESGLA